MRNTARYFAVFLIVALVIAVSIWGPEALAKYKDKEFSTNRTLSS